MRHDVLPVLMSAAMIVTYSPASFCAPAQEEQGLKFKIYAPESGSAPAPQAQAGSSQAVAPAQDAAAPAPQADDSNKQEAVKPADDASSAQSSADSSGRQDASAASASAPEPNASAASGSGLQAETPTAAASQDGQSQPAQADQSATSAFDTTPGSASQPQTKASDAPVVPAVEAPAATGAIPDTAASTGAVPDTTGSASDSNAQPSQSSSADGEKQSKQLQGYVRVVPKNTKIPIIMDTAVDTDTSQEGDEFEARTSEDLTIDGQIAVPAGSVIKGRIAQLNSPRHLNRSGSVALKFDTVTTPDNRQIPLVANLVAHGGVVHARRGAKDILIDAGTFTLPTAAGLAIGAIAGNANTNKLGVAGGALIGAGVGAVVGAAVLLAKKGKKIDVRPGDELKIELAEDLRMPMI